MADRLDVAERLAEGAPAVEHTQRYVRACHALGYQHPELTARPAQIRDCYDTEDGLNLGVLERDCAELRTAAGAVAEALRMQRAQVVELSAAWTGSGADAAVRFLQRHCDAADTVATEVRAAAQRCESLRDNLWHLLDVKVATAIAIDDRTLAQRPAWLAAADVVTTGVGDRPAADELVHLQITPYVDNEIRGDWLSTMRSTQAGVAASYDMVSDRLARAPRAHFEIPGDLGPTGGGPRLQPAPPPARAVGAAPSLVPAAVSSARPPDPAPPPTMTSPDTLPPSLAKPDPATASMPDWGAAPADASAMPTGAVGTPSGLGGLANRIVDAMGSLLDSVGGDQLDDEPAEEADDQPASAEEVSDIEESNEEVAGPTPPPAQEAPAQELTAPGPPPPAPTPNPSSGGKTPCEIAVDQLPQAG